MELKRAGSQPSQPGPSTYFTGTVRIDPLNAPPAPARHSCAAVTFEPGARSHWHTHPLGQTLIVTAGCGWTQCEGEEIVEIRAGDVIWCPPGHKHWHGATPTTAMTHIAVQEALDGRNVEWLQPVTDAQYARARDGDRAVLLRPMPIPRALHQLVRVATLALGLLLIAAAPPQKRQAMTNSPPVVRLAELQIDPAQLGAYLTLLRQEIEASVRLEPGVLTLNAVALKDSPNHIRLMEIYADQAAYEAHLKSPHFAKYKTATATMVRSLTLHETTPIALRSNR